MSWMESQYVLLTMKAPFLFLEALLLWSAWGVFPHSRDGAPRSLSLGRSLVLAWILLTFVDILLTYVRVQVMLWEWDARRGS